MGQRLVRGMQPAHQHPDEGLVEQMPGGRAQPGQGVGRESEVLLELLLDHEAGDAGFGLDVDVEALDAVAVLDDHAVVGQDAGDLEQRLLHLLREEVHAGDDEHVVEAPADLVEPRMGASAGAGGARDDSAAVAGLEAEHRQRLAGEGGDDDFAEFAVGQRPAGVVVDDLGDVVVVPDVQAAVVGAVHAERADAAGLGHAVDVEDLDAEAAVDALAHFAGEGLRAEDADLEGGQLLLLLLEHLHDAHGVGDDAGDDARAEVLG